MPQQPPKNHNNKNAVGGCGNGNESTLEKNQGDYRNY